MSTKDAKNRLKTIERWWLKPSSLKLCIYYEVINKWCWQTQSLHKSSNSLPHRVPSIQDWVAKWRSGEVAKTHYILLYRASSGGNKSSHNRTDSTSTTSTYQRKYWIYWKDHRLSSPREIDSPPYFSRDSYDFARSENAMHYGIVVRISRDRFTKVSCQYNSKQASPLAKCLQKRQISW